MQFLVSSVLLNHLLACPYLLKDLQPVGYPFLSDNDAESYNEMLRDFVNKQELQRDLRSYIDAATRKEALRMSYLDLIRDKYVIKYVSHSFQLYHSGDNIPRKSHCPLCDMPHQYISYLVRVVYSREW